MIPTPTSIWQIIIPATMLLVVVVLGHLFDRRRRPYIVPVTDGTPRANQEGSCLRSGICPKCHEDDFYIDGCYVYCANRDCRAAYQVVNYGKGQVWADEIEQAPDEIYR